MPKPIPDDYCVSCGEDGPLDRKMKYAEFDVRGDTLQIEFPVRSCSSCGTVTTEPDVDPAEIAFAKYRKQKKLLSPVRIKEIRERYRLSQKSFAALLGMGEATINRYEGGGIQDEAHDNAIRSSKSPDGMRDLLDRRGERLSDWQRKRVEAVLAGESKPMTKLDDMLSGVSAKPKELTAETGYRDFDYLLYALVVVWLCQHVKMVTATSLNKLMFYVDFLHYKCESVSLTGSKYRRVQHGPVPAEYGDLQNRLELDGFIRIKEIRHGNGHTGLRFRVGPDADQIDREFSSRELKILETVARALKGMTPSEIRKLSHKERAWKDTEDRALIVYDKAMDLSLSAVD